MNQGLRRRPRAANGDASMHVTLILDGLPDSPNTNRTTRLGPLVSTEGGGLFSAAMGSAERHRELSIQAMPCLQRRTTQQTILRRILETFGRADNLYNSMGSSFRALLPPSSTSTTDIYITPRVDILRTPDPALLII